MSGHGGLLGAVVIAGSSLSKLPQILNIYRANSTSGLSIAMYCMESACQLTTILYHVRNGHGFSVWGENLTLGLGNAAILYLHSKLNGHLVAFNSTILGSAILSKLLLSRAGHMLDTMYAVTIGVYIASRVPQILSIYQSKSSGVLSPITFAANGIGSIIRLITSAAIGDRKMMVFMLISIVCNYTLVAQILYYRYKSRRFLPGQNLPIDPPSSPSENDRSSVASASMAASK